MKSVMDHKFSRVPAPQIQRSLFDRSCGHKTSFDAGYLIPFFLDEILPGDTMKTQCTILARIATLLFPIMDNVFLDTFYFFVPNRLLWTNWERFNGAQSSPGDSIDYEIPVLDNAPTTIPEGTLGDYFGLPTQVAIPSIDAPCALPFRAYNLIYNEWFRDQNLQNSVDVPQDDGPDGLAQYALLRRGKRHDYFTSCLPWPQKGDSVQLPLGTSAPVYGTGIALGLWDGTDLFGTFENNASSILNIASDSYTDPVGTTPGVAFGVRNAAIGVTPDPAASGMAADLSTATSATINQIRQAFQFQKILERDARGGTRYVELLKAHFGVTSPDFRLQRPEYLGGYSQRVDVRSVPQTSESATTPQGTLTAYASVGSQSGFNKSFVEHGWVIGLVNVRADLTYQQQMHKMWSRRTRLEVYLPALAHLGEQAVLNKEIFYPAAGVNANLVFGYQERWAEYRYKPSMVTGKFRSNATGTLDAWHLAADFAAIPPLNAAFIVDDPPIDRVIAVNTEPHVIMDSYISIKHARPMPVYSVPGQIDRF